MSDEKQYTDQDGNPCTLESLCRLDPLWAANRIRAESERIAELEAEVERLREISDRIVAVSIAIAAAGDVIATAYEHELKKASGSKKDGGSRVMLGKERITVFRELYETLVGIIAEQESVSTKNHEA